MSERPEPTEDLRDERPGPVQGAHRRGPRGPAGAAIPATWRWVREHTLVWHLLGLAVWLVALYVLTTHVSDFRNLQIANVAVLVCATAGLTVLIGLNGQISIGHGAFMAVGAYTVAVLTRDHGWHPAVLVVIATVVSGLVGAIVGAAAARLRGPYLAGATLAFAVGLPGIASYHRTSSYLGGNIGLSIATPGPPSGVDVSLQRWQAWFAGFAAVLTIFLLANLARSRVGRSFRAVRDDEVAASLAGLNVSRIQIIAFIVSAAAAGLGGAILALVNGLAAPGAFTLVLSITLLSAVIIGGLGSLMGAVYGSIVLVVLPNWASNFGASHNLSNDVQSNIPLAIYGGALILVMLVFPLGIQGGLRRLVALVGSGVARVRSSGPR